MTAALPEPLVRFGEMFNRGAFWESHEVLEVPWRQRRSGFYKGLILLASAWVHVQRSNPRGIEAQLRKAQRELEVYRPAYLGVDVDALLAHADRALSTVAAHREAVGHRWESLVPPPRLLFEAARVRGDEPELQPG